LRARGDHGVRGGIVVLGFFRRVLGDGVVLAVLAAEVTARSGQRKRQGPGQKVVEGFFLDGIDVDRAGVAIDKGVQLAPAILAHAAGAAFPFDQDAAMWAELAADVLPLVGHVTIECPRGLGKGVAGGAVEATVQTGIVEGFAGMSR
jgi:uncharacterized SAM-binding protein YcdF (DUF218 family)